MIMCLCDMCGAQINTELRYTAVLPVDYYGSCTGETEEVQLCYECARSIRATIDRWTEFSNGGQI